MKIIIIGSGLIGVCSAWFLRREGHDVTVIDRQHGVGRETSFANGGLLTPSMSDPWNAPGSWRVLLASTGRSDAAMQLRLKAVPALARWGIEFLRNSSVARYERNTLSNLSLALYSLRVMQSLRRETQIEYGQSTRGTLRLFRREAALERATEAVDRSASHALACRRLTTAELVELEPALSPIASQLRGAIHYAADEAGDAHRFCVELAERAREQGVEFRFGVEVSSIEIRSGQVSAVVCGRERFLADLYVLAAGSYSEPLVRRIGFELPVRPVKGYSVTFSRAQGESCHLQTPIVDDELHAVVVPFPGALRVAGTAEFTGYDLVVREARIRNLVSLAQRLLPGERFSPASASPWCGLRPMSVDGVPIIGFTPVSNLMVNTGHGHLGWTMAAGSARLLADLLCACTPAIDPAPYTVARFRTRP